MLEVKIPIEIHDYKSKLIAGLSIRQLVSIGGAILCALPIGVFGRGHISSDILPWFIILVTIPWVFYGFVKIQGMVFEDYVRSWIRFQINPKIRVYEETDDNLLQTLHEELVQEQIKQQKLESGDYEEIERK